MASGRRAVCVVLAGVLLVGAIPCRCAAQEKKYAAINLLLAAVDYETAHAAQRRGGCYESNAFFNRYPSRGRFYVEGLAIDAGPELLGWLLHRKRVRIWKLPFAVVAAWHGDGIITNLRCGSGR